jgi:hypothetical protein
MNAESLALLERVYEMIQRDDSLPTRPVDFERHKHDFAFHMTDWYTEIQPLQRLFDSPRQWSDDAAAAFVVGFLHHVVPHLNAATRLLLGAISDPFAPPGDSSGRAAHPERQ